MAYKEYRNPANSPLKLEFNIERFAYDVFAYMLPICGFPIEKLPTTCLRENIYTKDDFVMNVGLSALPIALYMRDEWKITFDEIFKNNELHSILESHNYLESYIAYSGELEEEDSQSKIQFSLALYNEYMLFLNFKGVESYFDILPKLWSRLCKELLEQSEDTDVTVESTLTMYSDVSEVWIINFMRNFGIPYGSLNDVSERFSMYTLKCQGEENDIFPEETFAEGTAGVSRASDVSDEDTVTFYPEGSNSEENFMPGRWNPPNLSSQLQISLEKSLIEPKAHSTHTNGFTFVLHHCLKGKKRSRSQKLEVEDTFGGLNLEKENISPENRDTKRRRKISG